MSDYIAVKLGSLRDGATIAIDSKLSLTSSNPVQNKIVTKAIEDLKKAINDFPDADILVTIENVEEIVNEKLANFSGSTVNIKPIDEEIIRQLFKSKDIPENALTLADGSIFTLADGTIFLYADS